MTSAKWLKLTALWVVAGLLGIGGLVIVVDPFFHYHGPIAGFPYQIDNQTSQNPGMARHFQYDSVMLGSSMTVNFESKWFAEEMGLDMVKLCYNGAYPRDIYNIMEKVDTGKQPLKQVF